MRMHQSLDELVRGPTTLAHRDFRLDNLFFEGTPERVVVVDWQMASRMVGTYDVACLLTQSTPVQLRQQRQWEVLRAWHDRVRSRVATSYSYEDAVADYRRSALVGLLKPVLGGAYHEPGDARGDQLSNGRQRTSLPCRHRPRPGGPFVTSASPMGGR